MLGGIKRQAHLPLQALLLGRSQQDPLCLPPLLLLQLGKAAQPWTENNPQATLDPPRARRASIPPRSLRGQTQTRLLKRRPPLGGDHLTGPHLHPRYKRPSRVPLGLERRRLFDHPPFLSKAPVLHPCLLEQA